MASISTHSGILAYFISSTNDCLVAIVGNDLKIDRSTYEILQVLGISLLDKTPVKELFANTDYNDVKERNYNQLSLNLI